jgi:hypothetical protein
MTTEAQTARPEGMTNLLFDRGTLIHLYIGRWTGNRKMSQNDLLLEDVDDKAMNVGFKKLMPADWHNRFQRIESEARILLASLSTEFPIGNARFMFYRVVPDFLRRVQPLKNRWDRAVEEFVAEYAQLKERQLELLDAQARKLVDQELALMPAGERKDARRKELATWLVEQQKKNEKLYPKAEEIRFRFSFTWRMFKISAVEGVEQMNTMDQTQLVEAQQMVHQEMQRWAREASQEVHQAFGRAAANANELLTRHGRLTPRNLRPLFEAFEQFRALEFSGTSDFNGMIDQIRRQFLVTGADGSADYAATAERMNSNQEALGDLLSSIGNLAVDEVASEAGIRSLQRTGEFGRYVDLN